MHARTWCGRLADTYAELDGRTLAAISQENSPRLDTADRLYNIALRCEDARYEALHSPWGWILHTR
jgi:hypothetical protein